MKLGVIGASGRMGQEIISILPEFSEFILARAIVSTHSKVIGDTALGTVRFSDDLEEAILACDCLVDFSKPEVSLRVAELVAKNQKVLLIGTTGFNQAQLQELHSLTRRSKIVVIPNTSLGATALAELSTAAKEILGEKFKIQILDIHHGAKRDAPSGTALKLAERLKDTPSGDQNSIAIASLRGGDAVGEHTVYFLGLGERLELTHRVSDRKVFARGALSHLLKFSR